ncbi:uncharacterized protein LOC135082893 [Ostrinia nubilalis]|uniref:uncharacterized protein LOC135082893 n=1 Tax=Ostrinia nubilalis TaxID=29057 RepID=UPI0030825C05
MTLSEYTQLKQQLVFYVGGSERHSQLLSTLKEHFRDDINSPRRYEKIVSIGQLLRVLEIRDVLSENNVGPLKEIARRIPNGNDLLQKINEYELNRVPTEFVNLYASENIHSTPHRPAESFVTSNPNTAMSEAKKQRIIDTVIDNIGTYWRDLARSLDIKEKIIDKLNESNKPLHLRAKTIMDMYQKIADSQNWFFELCDALETCRRRDLVKKLKKIATMNI